MLALVERMKRGQVQVLLVHQADPVYQVPPVVGFTGAIAEVPFIVSFSSFVDDTTAYADLILPDHTYLESWGIVLPEPNPGRPVASSLQPVVSPVFDTRPVGDVLISVARAIGGPIKAALKWPSYIDLVRTTWASLPGQTGESWMTVRQSGGWVGPALPVPASPSRAIGLPTTVPKASFAGDPHAFPFLFLPYPSIPLHDGRSANLPWQQELPDTMTTGVWSSWLEVNPKTAQELDLAEGDPVEVSSPYGMLRVRIHLYPGLHPDVVAMPLGQGHTTYGRYAANRGANALSLVGPELVTGSGDLAWASTRVRLRKVDDAPRFTKVERRDWLPESHEAPGYLSLEDLTRQRWPWDGTHVTE